MQLRQVTPRYFVSPQISPEDLAGLVEAGFSHVICNRPDAEVPASHQADAVAAAAKAAGVEFVVNPLTHDTMTPDRLSLQRDTLEAANGKVLAYCASGTRSTVAWSLAHATDMATDEILNAATAAGYDLAGLRPTLDAIASQG